MRWSGLFRAGWTHPIVTFACVEHSRQRANRNAAQRLGSDIDGRGKSFLLDCLPRFCGVAESDNLDRMTKTFGLFDGSQRPDVGGCRNDRDVWMRIKGLGRAVLRLFGRETLDRYGHDFKTALLSFVCKGTGRILSDKFGRAAEIEESSSWRRDRHRDFSLNRPGSCEIGQHRDVSARDSPIDRRSTRARTGQSGDDLHQLRVVLPQGDKQIPVES